MLNKVMLIGNLGADPELINANTKQARCTFSLATSEMKKAQDGSFERTPVWHNIVAFGKTAETTARAVSKGRQVLVEGKLQQKHWEDKNGNKHSSYEIIANSIYPLGQNSARTSDAGDDEDAAAA
ncbi:MAG TPA: single-stranded DNA-binding protein [Oligoflexia bacterium]|nr:single-stranded DNA-binding protein [Oligoflexia bacterium]